MPNKLMAEHYSLRGKDDCLDFDNSTEWFEAAEAPPEPGSYAENPNYRGRRSRDTSEAKWFGTPSWESAVKLRKDGWPEGLDRAEKLSNKITGVISGLLPVQEVAYDTSGDFIDMGRFVEGEPECFGFLSDTEDNVPAPFGKIVRIGVNWAISAAVSAETIERRGAAIIALTRLLELCGRSVTVDAIWSTSNRGGSASIFKMKCHLKKSGETLSPEVMAFGLGHPSFLRRFCFSIMEQLPMEIAQRVGVGSGYGLPCDTEQEYDIYLPHMLSSDFNGDEGAIKWVEDALSKQGVSLEA